MTNINDIVEKGVYFLLGEPSFHYSSICLAEGLKAIGVPIFANKNCWLINLDPPEYLFQQHDNIHPNDCAICAIDVLGIATGWKHPINEINYDFDPNLILIIIDRNDSEIRFNNLDRYHAVLRTHIVNTITYPNNYIPWVFGISNRIQQTTQNNLSFEDKRKEALSIFRTSTNQGVRVAMDLSFIPHLESKITINRKLIFQDEVEIESGSFHDLYHSQIKTHHIPKYFEALKQAQFCCCYGGNFSYVELLRNTTTSHELEQKSSVVRWDSWRLWEAFAAGCVVIHLDFEKYGFRLPIQPVNWKHYVGIDLSNPKATAERILDEPETMAKIASEGKIWALENYNSISVACRFLDIAIEEELGITEQLINLLNNMS